MSRSFVTMQGYAVPSASPPPFKAVSSIGSAPGRDYPDVATWATAMQVAMAAQSAGVIPIAQYPNGLTGQLYNDSEFQVSVQIELGQGVDTSQFNNTGVSAITLTTGPGQSFRDNGNVRNNALAYNQANGVGINFNITPGPNATGGLKVHTNNTRISGLQFKLTNGNWIAYTDISPINTPVKSLIIENCILDDYAGGTPVFSGTVTLYRNCLILSRGQQDYNACPHGSIFDGPAGPDAYFYFCTIVANSDNTNGSPPGYPPQNAWTSSAGEGGGTTTFVNCAFFGWQEVSDYSSGSAVSYTACATNSALTTQNPFCTGNATTFTGTISGNSLTVSNVAGFGIAIGDYIQGTGIPFFTFITGGSGTSWTIGGPPLGNIGPEPMKTNPTNTVSITGGMTGNVAYNTGTFVGVTSAAADFRLASSSPLIGGGVADATNGATDISGFPRPTLGATDIGCWEITPPSLQMTVNGSNGSPMAVTVAGDHIHVGLVNVGDHNGFLVRIVDGAGVAYNAVPSGSYLVSSNTNYDLDIALSTRDGNGNYVPIGYGGGFGTTPGTYYAKLFFQDNSNVAAATVPFTINPFIPYPFPRLGGQLNPNQPAMVMVAGAAAGGTVLAGNGTACLAVRGPITAGPAAYNIGSVTNVTMQFYLVDGNLTYHPIGNSPSTGPITGSLPNITSFDTTTVADGSYELWARIIDVADTSGNNWVAADFIVIGHPLIIQNGGSAMNPAGTYKIPVSYPNQNGLPRSGSTGVNAIPYNGVPAPPSLSPYPSDSVVGNYLLPVYNASSPFNANPVSARNPPLGFWWQGVDGVRTNEYKTPMQFSQTNAGGIFAQYFIGKTTGTEGIEAAYSAVVAGSYNDGGRNSNQTTNFTAFVATPSVGPWSAYHWTFIQEDGRLGVMDLTGTKVTIAGRKRDPAQLQFDWNDQTNPEFPNSIQVGTIDTNPMYTFGDFGGAAADCCWDPRDPYICYVSQTIDCCIIKVNFHTQTLNGVNYNQSNPLCQRYAGYKGGLMGNAYTGYVDGPALDTVVSGVQCTAILSGASISNGSGGAGTTLTYSSASGGTVAVGQYVSDTNGGGTQHITNGTYITGFISGNSWNVSVSQLVTSETMYTNSGAQFSAVYSLCMQKRTDNPSYPQGTMFIADNYNGLIRMVSAAPIDGNGNFTGVGPTVTTLTGTANGAMPPATVHSNPTQGFGQVIGAQTAPISVTSIQLVNSNTASVVLAPAPASTIGANHWNISLLQNGTAYFDGDSSHPGHAYGIYKLSSITNSTNFQISPIANVPNSVSGAITVVVSAADQYSSPNPISITAPNCYTAFPNTVRMSSKGHIVVMEAWYNGMTRLIALSNLGGETAGTIRRIGSFGNIDAAPPAGNGSTAFAWLDVDDAVTSSAGAFTDPNLGACGPQDDVVMFKTDSNPGSASVADRWSLDGSFNYYSTFDGTGWFGDTGPDFPSEGLGGVGHYPWAFCFSKTAFRMASMGLDPTGWFQWRPAYPGDPPRDADAIGGQEGSYHPYTWLESGWNLWQFGTRAIFPNGFRPAISAIMGATGYHFYGANTGPTIDDIPVLYPTNAALGQYIQNGFFGGVKLPEFSFDDDGVTPSRHLAAVMYFIRRMSLSGSWPTRQAPLFAGQNPADGSGWLIAPGQWSLNYVRPQITVTSGYPLRVSSTSIRVRWTTDKNTLGIVIAGTPHSNVGAPYLYSLWTTLEMDNNAAWGTTHDVTITGLPAAGGGNTPNNVAVLVIDRAGNWNMSSNFSVS